MSNSKTYWGQTLNEIEKNFCACECVNEEQENNIENENGEELHDIKDLDNLFSDKSNKNDFPNETNGILLFFKFILKYFLKKKL